MMSLSLSVWMPLFLCSANTASQGPSGVELEPPAPAEENVTRFYDVASLWSERQQTMDRYFKLAAHHSGSNYNEGTQGSLDSQRGADEIVSILVDLLGSEFEYEGRLIQAVEYGRILLRGPEGLHKRVSEVLVFLDELVNAQMELTVSVIELEPAGEFPFSGRAVVPRVEVERWLGSVSPASSQQEFRLNLRADRAAELDLTRSTPVLLDYDVEIAQAAIIGDPIVQQMAVGTQAYVYATPAPEGVALSVILKRSDLIGEIRERSLRMGGQVRTDAGMIETSPSTVFQTYDLIGSGFAFDALLRKDQALVLHDRIDLSRERRDEVIVLRWTGGELPFTKTLHHGPAGEELVAIDLDFAAPFGLRAGGSLVDPAGLPFKLFEWISGGTEEGILGVRLEEYSSSYAMDLISSQSDSLSMLSVGRHTLIRYFDYSGVAGADAAREMAKVRAAIQGMQSEERLIEFGVKLSRLGKWAGTPIVASFPLRLNHSAAVALGIENPVVYDCDVEVAQDASVSDAQVLAEFEGLVLWLNASRSPRGDLLLDVSAGASQATTLREALDLGTNDLEQSTCDQLFARQRLTFRADQAGPWVAVIGDTSGGKGAAGSLKLEITVAK